MIAKLILRNFKSYAGAVEIGPFHKSFTSIVGPNGSGKSNVIDALLFVFGFKAKKMRQGKLSDLIHKSAQFPDLDSGGVEVHFHEIVDLPGPDAYRVVEDSQLIVSRTVEKSAKSDKSTYRINGRASSFGEVTDLLKGKGVDLDHKRFLILQGEVESIALMKPKAPSEHEDGLLEYMEDIIGTSKYKEQIEALAKELDTVSEEREEKLHRLKIVEKEKTSLEPKKKEAEKFLETENELAVKRNQLHQVDRFEKMTEIETCNQEIDQLKTQLEQERSNFSTISIEVNQLEQQYSTVAREYQEMFERTEAMKKEAQKTDRKEVELREKEKHLVTKKKKVEKALKQDIYTQGDHKTWMKNFDTDLDKTEVEVNQLNDRLAREEKELEAISEALKGKTQIFQRQIEEKQVELLPWVEKINGRQSKIDVAQSELNLLIKRSEAAQSALAQAQKNLAEFVQSKEEQLESVQEEESQLEVQKNTLHQLKIKLQKYADKEALLQTQLNSARDKVAEARMAMQSSQSRNAILSNLLKQKQSGKIPGICGRLGDLGVIDDKYDVAITTACGSLNSIVVETVECGQKCLEFIKAHNLGQATFLCLDKIKPINPNNLKFNAPEHSKRLFDLVTPKEARFKPAFFHALNNTLVTDDMKRANAIAFGGPVRQRVVTLDGVLVDVSGTMSGGGSKPQCGGMCSKFKSANVVSPEQLAELEAEERACEAKLEEHLTKKRQYEAERDRLVKDIPLGEFRISKLQMGLQSVEKQILDAEKQVQVLSKKSDGPSQEDLSKMTELKTIIVKLQSEICTLQVSKNKIDDEIKSLQDQILQAGGVKLRSQKATVDGIVELIDGCNNQIKKLKVEKSTREKALVKIEASIERKELELKEADAEYSEVEKTLLEVSKAQSVLKNQLGDAEGALEDKASEKEALKSDLDSKSSIITNFKTVEMRMVASIADKDKIVRTAHKIVKELTATIASLELQVTGFEEEPLEPLREYTPEEMAMMDAAILEHDIEKLNGALSKMTPNLNALTEYRQKMTVYLARFKELEDSTAKRDEIRNSHEKLRKKRLDEFMDGFYTISYKLKEMYQMITLGGNAELELVDSMDPFSEGIIFSVMPPKKSWKNICNLSGGEKTLSSLALVFALHHYKPTPLYFMDEIDAALDFRNVSIVANYIKERTKNAQFIIISLRNNMFELADRLVGIYKTENTTKSITINPNQIVIE
ncbi:RecF/RecN/SMC protein [Obelidium mucronatum]|nr:RecF/RecN/SMC protein [Obelidium mucronatum]